MPDFEDIGPRLAQIERSISDNRQTILESAKVVAEQTIRQVNAQANASGTAAPAVAALADDLKALDNLARRSDERNARTFEAIHDTLLKIVDRLGTIENGTPDRQPQRKVAVAPSLEPELAPEEPDFDPPVRRPAAAKRSPAEAAAAAASAAIGGTEDSEDIMADPSRRTMLGGIAKALSNRKTGAEAGPLAGDGAAPIVDVDAPLDPGAANVPLEPGTAPDLNAIVNRVRNERGQAGRSQDADTAKADFIAAARRAALAAASEAETRRRPEQEKARSGEGLVGTLKRHRKTLLMAAGGVVIMLGALQLGKAFMSGTDEISSSAEMPMNAPVVEGHEPDHAPAARVAADLSLIHI